MIPSGEDLLIEIDGILRAHPAGEEAPTLGICDGLLAGMLVVGGLPPETWQSLLKAGPDAGFADLAEGERLATLLLARQQEIEAEFRDDDCDFSPVFDLSEEDEPLWQYWLLGFFSALRERPDQLAKMHRSKDEDLQTALAGLMGLIAKMDGSPLPPEAAEDIPFFDEMLDLAPDLVGYYAETLFRRRNKLKRIVRTNADEFYDDWPLDLPAPVVKVGRNEACPCGSGKKFKKCCGQ